MGLDLTKQSLLGSCRKKVSIYCIVSQIDIPASMALYPGGKSPFEQWIEKAAQK